MTRFDNVFDSSLSLKFPLTFLFSAGNGVGHTTWISSFIQTLAFPHRFQDRIGLAQFPFLDELKSSGDEIIYVTTLGNDLLLGLLDFVFPEFVKPKILSLETCLQNKSCYRRF